MTIGGDNFNRLERAKQITLAVAADLAAAAATGVDAVAKLEKSIADAIWEGQCHPSESALVQAEIESKKRTGGPETIPPALALFLANHYPAEMPANKDRLGSYAVECIEKEWRATADARAETARVRTELQDARKAREAAQAEAKRTEAIAACIRASVEVIKGDALRFLEKWSSRKDFVNGLIEMIDVSLAEGAGKEMLENVMAYKDVADAAWRWRRRTRHAKADAAFYLDQLDAALERERELLGPLAEEI